MKKFIIAIIVIILLGIGYFLIAGQSLKLSPQTFPEGENVPTEQPITQPLQEASFNTNDNLDEALQELDQLEQL